jgi:glucosamine 6-phosphate synthetase-like amidotransferase/phosphosugar isomerase protein
VCGIVAYIGDRKCKDILINGLKRLEYRGYDSSGIAVMSDNIETVNDLTDLEINVVKELCRNVDQPRNLAKSVTVE